MYIPQKLVKNKFIKYFLQSIKTDQNTLFLFNYEFILIIKKPYSALNRILYAKKNIILHTTHKKNQFLTLKTRIYARDLITPFQSIISNIN